MNETMYNNYIFFKIIDYRPVYEQGQPGRRNRTFKFFGPQFTILMEPILVEKRPSTAQKPMKKPSTKQANKHSQPKRPSNLSMTQLWQVMKFIDLWLPFKAAPPALFFFAPKSHFAEATAGSRRSFPNPARVHRPASRPVTTPLPILCPGSVHA
jgi:hypothetical protein